MNEWASKTLKILEDRRESKRIQEQVFLEKRQIQKAHGLPLWRQVKQIAENNCAAFNLEAGNDALVVETTKEAIFRVAANIDEHPGTLHASFDEKTGKLSWHGGGKHGECSLVVTDDGEARFQDSGHQITPTSIAEQMLSAVVLGPR